MSHTDVNEVSWYLSVWSRLRIQLNMVRCFIMIENAKAVENLMRYARFATAIKTPNLIEVERVAAEVKEFLGLPASMKIPHKVLLDKYRRVCMRNNPEVLTHQEMEAMKEFIPNSEDWEKLFDMEK